MNGNEIATLKPEKNEANHSSKDCHVCLVHKKNQLGCLKIMYFQKKCYRLPNKVIFANLNVAISKANF